MLCAYLASCVDPPTAGGSISILSPGFTLWFRFSTDSPLTSSM